MNRTVACLEEIATHLAAFDLHEPASVEVARYESQSWVQLGAHTLAPLADQLLAWADTIAVDGLEIWRPRDGRSVHVELYGHLPSLRPLRVYGAITYRPALFPDLQPGGRLSVSLTVLRAWANEDTDEGAAA